MHTQAVAAIRAAENWKCWGHDATMRFLTNRNCPRRLYYLARMLQAIEGKAR